MGNGSLHTGSGGGGPFGPIRAPRAAPTSGCKVKGILMSACSKTVDKCCKSSVLIGSGMVSKSALPARAAIMVFDHAGPEGNLIPLGRGLCSSQTVWLLVRRPDQLKSRPRFEWPSERDVTVVMFQLSLLVSWPKPFDEMEAVCRSRLSSWLIPFSP